ncbi:hypothetical protein F5B22DRAFT_373515 [Xylaria bambusicola]|uniref:uncharacterized protein n=1 Tax=Xylaria bambusicola TaxID=326684 RepID=UPI002008C22C|nr:uncharacterized protein F5B22DRAFT_373515 [Xylaria bambusicola]KAI0509128.1 hypothetical protein F5B22DRAFT_373515 [Xylaria bambusicola]
MSYDEEERESQRPCSISPTSSGPAGFPFGLELSRCRARRLTMVFHTRRVGWLHLYVWNGQALVLFSYHCNFISWRGTIPLLIRDQLKASTIIIIYLLFLVSITLFFFFFFFSSLILLHRGAFGARPSHDAVLTYTIAGAREKDVVIGIARISNFWTLYLREWGRARGGARRVAHVGWDQFNRLFYPHQSTSAAMGV